MDLMIIKGARLTPALFRQKPGFPGRKPIEGRKS